MEDSVSLNKFLSHTGLCSRREADKWIESGRVKINGRVAKKGNRVLPSDSVSLDDEPVGGKMPKSTYIIFNKPIGVTTTTDANDKSNIIDFIGHEERIFPVGRLDKDSSGLIILTNDGDVVNKILRSEHNHEKEYIVTVDRPVNKGFIEKMSNGVPILGRLTKKCEVEAIGKCSFRIVLTQGMNRQIRRMCEHLGYRVRGLQRIRIMNLHLGRLKPGKWRNIKKEELAALFSTMGDVSSQPIAPKKRKYNPRRPSTKGRKKS